MDDLPAYHTHELVAVVRRLRPQRLYSYLTLLCGKSRLFSLSSFLFITVYAEKKGVWECRVDRIFVTNQLAKISTSALNNNQAVITDYRGVLNTLHSTTLAQYGGPFSVRFNLAILFKFFF